MPRQADRLAKQMAFIKEVDKLKNVFRRAYISDQSRRENDAEHSWHLALMTLVLIEHADAPNLDQFKIVKMHLLHDIVEIDAGDTYIYDEEAKATQQQREEAAADRIFNILPSDQAVEFRALWDEFEKGETPEARFARALDRLHPMFLNYLAGGKAWVEHGITESQVRNVNSAISEGSEDLWAFTEGLIKDAVATGKLSEG